jgi:hypothetical protein
VAYKPWSASHAAPPPPLDRPVWVHLDLLYGPPESPDPIADPVPGGLLVATGRVPGLLKRWTRAADGRWFGCSPGLGLTVGRFWPPPGRSPTRSPRTTPARVGRRPPSLARERRRSSACSPPHGGVKIRGRFPEVVHQCRQQGSQCGSVEHIIWQG